MGHTEDDRGGARHPTLEVKRVTLDDGLHASLILENGRICKLVSPSGEVAVLTWEGDQNSSIPFAASSSQMDASRVSMTGRPAGRPEGFDAARNFWASKGATEPQHQASGAKDRQGRRGSSERSASGGRELANTSESSEGNSVGPGPAEGQCISVPLPEDAAAELPTYTKEAHGAGRACLETSAAVEDADAPAAGRACESLHTEDASRQKGEMEQAQQTRDEEAVDFWPNVEEAAQAGVNGGVEQGADESGDLLASSEQAGADVPAGQQREADDDVELAERTSLPASQRNLTEEHADHERDEARQHSFMGEHASGEPEAAALTGERAGGKPEEASQHGSEEDDRLEELMGAVPTINLRELRTQVASLPEILSRAERTAELCARGSAPGRPGVPGSSEHNLADGSIHSWVAQSRATAIMMQREQHMPRQHTSFDTGAAQPGRPQGEAEQDGPRREEERSRRAEGSAAGSGGSPQAEVSRRLTAPRSLADVRAAIGIVPSPEPVAPGDAPQPGKEEEDPCKGTPRAEANAGTQALIQPTVTQGTSVWVRLFLGRSVRPESAGSRASAARSAAPSPAKVQQMSMRERLFTRKPQGIILAEWPVKPCAEAMAPAEPPLEPGAARAVERAAASAMEEPATSAATSALTHETGARQGTRKLRRHPSKATATRTGMAGRWRMQECEGALEGAQQVENLLDLPLLQRLAQQRAQEIRILEADDIFEFIQIIPLNGKAKIVRRTVFPKSGKMVETARADSREGKLRSQLNISPEGHCHMRSLQGEPYAAVFHRRIKMSSGGHRLKIEQKFQLLAPGVMPVKYHSIWHRIEDSNADDMAAVPPSREPLLEM